MFGYFIIIINQVTDMEECFCLEKEQKQKSLNIQYFLSHWFILQK